MVNNKLYLVYFVNKLLETKFFWSDRITYLVYTCMYTRIRAYILSYIYYPIQMFFYFVDLHYLPVISTIRCTPCYGSQTTSLLYVFDWSQIQVLKNVNLIPIIWRAGEAANDSINVQTLASLLRNYEKTKLLLTLNSLNKTRDCVPF